jgi:AcrR family transcriptional regulator
MTTSPDIENDTRAKLIRAGERLFAAHGIEGVSLREITRSADQANVSALQYHFDNRVGLLRAIVAKHRADTEPRRHALLDQYEVAGEQDMRALAAALVRPLVAKLHDPDGGREYLQINSDIYTRPDIKAIAELVPFGDMGHSMVRWHALLRPLVSGDEQNLLHISFPAIRFSFVELARRAAREPRDDESLFASHTIDLVTALLTAPVSAETVRILDRPVDPT